MKGLRRDRRGFTLIELVVVITILGVLAAVAIPSVGGYVDNAKKKAAKADAKNIQTALLMYRSENNAYPSGIAGYDALRTCILDYVSLPAEESRANFTFQSYATDATHGFYALIKARDSDTSSITIYQDDIIGP
ncbi:MAG: prepilin-type N-terminal cleavage/methylation domain-containing protein [Bacillota bacterium]|nr:prepilin-type N-terminal cleavage/methylation domain-containing protein [Bacillota bacterium]